jgi:putative endonuclease
MSLKSDPQTWTDPRHLLGLDGELAALEHLLAKGYRILEHRFRIGRFEVDLIAARDNVVAFVEVKTRRGMRHGRPSEAVTWERKREMERVARVWEDRNRGRDGPQGGRRADGASRTDRVIRFDVVEVLQTRNGGVVVTRHIEDAFRPGWR